jgi:hypothetical protein
MIVREAVPTAAAEGLIDAKGIFGVAGNANPERAVQFPAQKPDLDPASNDNDCA